MSSYSCVTSLERKLTKNKTLFSVRMGMSGWVQEARNKNQGFFFTAQEWSFQLRLSSVNILRNFTKFTEKHLC